MTLLTLLNLLFLSLESRSDGLIEVAWPLSLLLDVLEHVDTGLAAFPPLRPRSSLFRYKLEDLTDDTDDSSPSALLFEPRPPDIAEPRPDPPEPGLGESGASDFQLLLEFRLEDP